MREALQSFPDAWKYNDDTATASEECDGFYPDGSFIQHLDIPYTATYGKVLLAGVGEILYVIQGTEAEQFLEKADSLFTIIEASFMPLFFNGTISDSVAGRSLTRNEDCASRGYEALKAILLLSTFAPPDSQNRLRSQLRHEFSCLSALLSKEHSPFYTNLIDELMKENHEFKYKDEFFAFPRMERFVTRTDKCSIVLALNSCKVGNYEAMNGENPRGWYLGDGAIYISDYYDKFEDYFRTVDFRYIPGTVEIIEDLEGKDIQRNALRAKNPNQSSSCDMGGRTVAWSFVNHDGTLETKNIYNMGFNTIDVTNNITKIEKPGYVVLANYKIKDHGKLMIDDKQVEPISQTVEASKVVYHGRTYRLKAKSTIEIKIENGFLIMLIPVERTQTIQYRISVD